MVTKLNIPQWQRVLSAIYKASVHNRYGGYLIRKLGGSRTHVRHLLSRLELRGLITLKRRENKKQITLTEKGERIAEAIVSVHTEFPRR